MLAFEDVFSSRQLPSGTWVFMGARQLPPAGRKLAEAVWQALTDAGLKVLNRPSLLMSRHMILDTMYRAGINDFRSYNPTEIAEDIRFPVFVRFAEQHAGSLSPLLSNRKELASFLRWQRLRGRKMHELLVVEFCDTANDRGEYRKYSAHYVNGELATQFLHVDLHWMVKDAASTFRDEWVFEEREFIRENSHAAEISQVFEIAKIDFGRLDYGLLNGKLQVWEINTNPSLDDLPNQRKVPSKPQRIKKLQEPGQKIFFERFHRILESIDSPHDPNAMIDFIVPETDVHNWHREVHAIRRRQQRRETLGKISEWPAISRAQDIVKYVLGVKRM